MPYFRIETNVTVDRKAAQDTAAAASAIMADLLGKPESYVLASFHPDTPLVFGGSREPAAMVHLKSIGLPKARCAELSEKICAFVEKTLKVPPGRVFIDFKDLDGKMFGWNGRTF